MKSKEMKSKGMKSKEMIQMLMDSAEIMHGILKNPKKQDLESTKILIASANTLAQTVKTMVQTEVIGLKISGTERNTTQLIHHVIDGE